MKLSDANKTKTKQKKRVGEGCKLFPEPPSNADLWSRHIKPESLLEVNRKDSCLGLGD